MEILGYKLYMSGFTLFLMIPFLFWVWVMFIRWRQVRDNSELEPVQRKRMKRAAIVSLIAFVVMHVDILFISYKANKICKEQGGMHIYKTAEAEGFIGGVDIEYWSTQGFKYVEYKRRKKKYRYVMENGKPKKFEVDKFLSRYKEIGESKILADYLEKTRYAMIDRETNEILSDLTYFSVYPGWVDGYYYGTSLAAFTPWFCGDKPPASTGRVNRWTISDLIEQTLMPKS